MCSRVVFFWWSYLEFLFSHKPTCPCIPGLCYKCSLCKSFYVLKRQYWTAWIFGTGCNTLKGVIALTSQQLSAWSIGAGCTTECLKVFESVLKCLKPPESARKWNKLYCSCFLLALLRIHGGISQNEKRKYGNLDWTIPVKYWFSWQFRENKGYLITC